MNHKKERLRSLWVNQPYSPKLLRRDLAKSAAPTNLSTEARVVRLGFRIVGFAHRLRGSSFQTCLIGS